MATSFQQAVAASSSPNPGSESVVPLRIVQGGASPVAGNDHEALLACLGDLLFQVSAEGEVLEVHCPPDHEFQLSPDGLVGTRLDQLLPEPLWRQAREWVQATLRTGEPRVYELNHRLGGRTRRFQVRMAPAEQGHLLALVRDITDRSKFEREILEVNQRTQHRIGQDLHDGLGQHLTGITFLSKALERKLKARNLPEADEASEIARLVIGVLSHTRQLARSLFPVELESGELVEALRELADSVQNCAKVNCRVESTPGLRLHGPDQANHLFRIAQEAVNNAVKHGQAHQVRIRLVKEEAGMRLSIEDDGVGFDPAKPQRQGMGLRIMQYRAHKIGGHLEFLRREQGGTEVICLVPPSETRSTSPDTNPS